MRDSVVFYRSFYEAICELPEENQLSAIKAILEYALNERNEATGTAMAILMMAQPVIDSNNKRYENGKKGGRPAKNESKNKADNDLTESESKPNDNQNATKAEPYVDVDVYVDDNTKKNNVRQSELESEFEEIWKIYPRKQGKKKALSAYVRARKNGTDVEEVRKGVMDYIEHISLNKIEPQYVKMGSTYFTNQSWQDDYSANYKRGRPDTRGTEREYDMRELELRLLATN